MAWYDNIVDNMALRIAGYMTDKRIEELKQRGAYYGGDQRKNIRIKPGGPDDNVTLNFTGLAVERSVSRLLRGGVEFALPDDNEAQQEYINGVWDTNKRAILLAQIALYGTVYGTCYAKIVPDALTNPVTGAVIPRIVALNPELMTIECDPMDKDKTLGYLIQWTAGDNAYKQVIRRTNENDDLPENTWVVEDWETNRGGVWQLVNATHWPYDFPPVHHWKNLHSLNSQYGSGDVDDSTNIQDRTNFTYSNTGKIIRLQAHRQRYGVGFNTMQSVDFGADKLPILPQGGEIRELDATGDLASSRLFALDLRQALFDISREVDISSMADSIGALTNFGLRVLWGDALDKNDTKRQLYGDGLSEVNRRLLVLAGYEGEASDPGAVVWGEAMPINETEKATGTIALLQAGVISKQTAAERLGIDWETETERMSAEQASGDNVGAAILRAFAGGGGGLV